MARMRLALFAFFTLLMMWGGSPPAHAAEQAQAAPVEHGEARVRQPQTNAEIRQWYNDQVANISELDRAWQRDGVSAEERARRAHDIRHTARVKARDFMPDKREVALLQARDQEKYGNPDGPSFDDLVAQNRKKGLTGDSVYEEIIGSAHRTNADYNKRFGVIRPEKAP